MLVVAAAIRAVEVGAVEVVAAHHHRRRADVVARDGARVHHDKHAAVAADDAGSAAALLLGGAAALLVDPLDLGAVANSTARRGVRGDGAGGGSGDARETAVFSWPSRGGAATRLDRAAPTPPLKLHALDERI